MAPRMLLLTSALLSFCSNPKRTNETESRASKDSLLRVDSIQRKSKTDSVYASSPDFKMQLERVASKLTGWGFKKVEDSSFRSGDDWNKHWCLRLLNRQDKKKKSALSTKSWQSIKVITQVNYKANGRLMVEEWQLADPYAARNWLSFLNSSQELNQRYPYNVKWVEGNNLYIINAATANDWADYSEELVEAFTGRKKSLVQLFAHPIDIAEYKKKKGGSNSGGMGWRGCEFKPDTTGFYYCYFWFMQLRNIYPSEILFNGLMLSTYMENLRIIMPI